MTVDKLIRLLHGYAATYGMDAQIAVHDHDGVCRENIFIKHDNISTVLTSKGPEVEW